LHLLIPEKEMMILTNLKLIFRNLWKSKITSSVNILGFALSLTACFIIGLYILNEFNYDKFNKNYYNIFRVVNEENQRSQIDYTIKEDILKEIPEVSDACHLLLRKNKIQIEYQDKTININSSASTDNNFFNIFSFPIVTGDQNVPFDNNIHSLLISEHVATLLFDKGNLLGERVKINDQDEYIVCGVFKDFPRNSSISAEIIQNEAYEINTHAESYSKNGKQEIQRTIFISVNNPAQVDLITRKINNLLAGQDKLIKKIRLQPLRDIYLFDNTTNWDFNKGNYSLIILFLGIAIITLILASINYINLSIAQYNQRTKETGVRKTFGAGRFILVKSFLVESIVITLISLILALLLTDTFLSLFNSLFNLQLQASSLISVQYIFIFIILIFVLGIINGIWPALIITSFNPVQIFQKRFLKLQGKDYIKNILTTIQFTASITLIICVLLIIKQLYFLKHKDLGFRDNNLLKITTNNITKFEPLKTKLLQNPLILDATYSSGIPGEINSSLSPGIDADFYTKGVPIIHGDASFIKTLQIDMLAGRDFLESENKSVCLISETASKAFGWGKDWPDKYFQRDNNNPGYKVVGVFKDIHFQSLYQEIEPLVIEYNDMQKSFLTLRISSHNVSEAMDYINSSWKEFEPKVSLDFAFYDTWFDSMYKKEEQLAKMVSSFAILAIIISCLGVFSQAVLNTINRTKEIGIRKINGAKIKEVMTMLNMDVIKWVFVAFLISAPIAWYFMNRWQQNFAYKTILNWWVFILGGLGVSVVTILTVTWQSWKAANINPVDCLKDE
jgi:putative ABC transport system permease protein